jgi:CRISPR/Cas system-associated protein Csx1
MSILKKTVFVGYLCLLSSNTYSQTNFIEKKAGRTIFLSIPDYLKATKSLNSAATMQFLNNEKEAYVIVIEDSKTDLEEHGFKYDSLLNFRGSMIENLISDNKKPIQSTLKSYQIDGREFIQNDLKVTLNDTNGTQTEICYLLTYVESSTNYYQILCWTLSQNYNDLRNDFKQIALSLRD